MLQNIFFSTIGFTIGYFILDIDHLIFWLISNNKLPESIHFQQLLINKHYKQAFVYFKNNKTNHLNLIFHHFYFQIIIIPITLFVLTSTSSIFSKSVIFALNFHLLHTVYQDLKLDPHRLQTWLFARMKTQLPLSFLPVYLKINIAIIILLGLLLIKNI